MEVGPRPLQCPQILPQLPHRCWGSMLGLCWLSRPSYLSHHPPMHSPQTPAQCPSQYQAPCQPGILRVVSSTQPGWPAGPAGSHAPDEAPGLADATAATESPRSTGANHECGALHVWVTALGNLATPCLSFSSCTKAAVAELTSWAVVRTQRGSAGMVWSRPRLQPVAAPSSVEASEAVHRKPVCTGLQ